MRIRAAVLTHRPVEHKRHDLLLRTLASLRNEIWENDLLLAHNGPLGADKEAFEKIHDTVGCYALEVTPGTSIGEGMNAAIQCPLGPLRADIVVFSNDDVEWRPGWRERLERFWTYAPPSVILAGGILEGANGWNGIIEAVRIGGEKALSRESTGAAAWTFRARDWGKIGPVPEGLETGEDLETCRRIRQNKNDTPQYIVQLDLADHLGYGRSVWGNSNEERDLNRKAWGFPLTKGGIDMFAKMKEMFGAEAAEAAAFEARQLFRERYAQIGISYQPALYELVRLTQPRLVVETGVRVGISTRYILEALKKNGAAAGASDAAAVGPSSASDAARDGLLVSCDPIYQDDRGALEKMKAAEVGAPPALERWRFLGKNSSEALPMLAREFPGTWDCFIHDSDHRADNMKAELEIAWKNLKVGGWMVVNTYHGAFAGNRAHKVWDLFVESKGLQYVWTQFGDAAFLQKQEATFTAEVETGRTPSRAPGVVPSSAKINVDSFKIPEGFLYEERMKKPTIKAEVGGFDDEDMPPAIVITPGAPDGSEDDEEEDEFEEGGPDEDEDLPDEDGDE